PRGARPPARPPPRRVRSRQAPPGDQLRPDHPRSARPPARGAAARRPGRRRPRALGDPQARAAAPAHRARGPRGRLPHGGRAGHGRAGPDRAGGAARRGSIDLHRGGAPPGPALTRYVPGMTYRQGGREARSILVTALSGSIFGLDPATGAVRWRHALGDGTIELQFRTGRVFASTSEVLYCFEYPSGVPLGRVKIPDHYDGGRATMLIEGDRIFVGTRGELSCFDLTGKVLWTQAFQGQGFGSVALGFPDNVRQADEGSR